MIVLMANKSEDQQAEFFAKSFREVVIPVLEDMEERLASKKDLEARRVFFPAPPSHRFHRQEIT